MDLMLLIKSIHFHFLIEKEDNRLGPEASDKKVSNRKNEIHKMSQVSYAKTLV